jgi:hypothetical protein
LLDSPTNDPRRASEPGSLSPGSLPTVVEARRLELLTLTLPA